MVALLKTFTFVHDRINLMINIMFFQHTLNINSHGYLASPDGGEFDVFHLHSAEFDQIFFETSNSRGF
jgi:hypothetical protein